MSTGRRPSPALTILMALAGIALLARWASKVNYRDIAAGFTSVGIAGFAIILALAWLRFAVRSYVWTALMRAAGARVSFARVVAASIAGDAAGNITFFSLLVSEPTKALYVAPAVPMAEGLASLAAENFFYSISVAVTILGGTTAFLAWFALGAEMREASLATVALMTALLVVAVWLVLRRPSLVSGLLSKLPGSLGGLAGRTRDLEQRAYRFLGIARARLGTVILGEALFHVLSIAESYLALWLITGSATLLSAFILDTVQRVITVLFRVIPFRLGVDQVGSSLVTTALGLGGATGFTMAFVRQGRILVWSIAGLALLARRGLSSRRTGAPDA